MGWIPRAGKRFILTSPLSLTSSPRMVFFFLGWRWIGHSIHRSLWQRLLLLRMMEDVPEETLQIKYEDGLQAGIQAKLNSLKPSSLLEAISYAHDAEKEINSITRMIQSKSAFSLQQFDSTTSMEGKKVYYTHLPQPAHSQLQQSTQFQSTPQHTTYTHEHQSAMPHTHTSYTHSQSATTSRYQHYTTRT